MTARWTAGATTLEEFSSNWITHWVNWLGYAGASGMVIDAQLAEQTDFSHTTK
ncbi:MAG: hypothetical protein IPI21_11110 [Propionivibrio sp.]|nr:hypothetical protein [Propionivibrio sp.]